VHIGVYLLALRHPVPVARQIATLCESAPGRLVLGVGVGGEDRHEIEICGVDPTTRGRRTDESLAALRALLSGEPVSHDCEFFSFEKAWIRPAPDPPVPIVVGGRSSAALRRAGRLGDGWLGVWCSPQRYAEARAEVEAHGPARTCLAARAPGLGRARPRPQAARERLSRAMEGVYKIPSSDSRSTARTVAPTDRRVPRRLRRRGRARLQRDGGVGVRGAGDRRRGRDPRADHTSSLIRLVATHAW
jgi:alkanesulfonate monooxygenase SsuD/methylene tetrahydromethanopterin reductase-like flavin-dependent oxidoreductase (luciferase family)